MHGADEVARADERNSDFAVRGRGRGGGRSRNGCGIGRAFLVLEHGGQGRILAGEGRIRLARAVDRQLQLDELLQRDVARGQQPQEFLHVAARRPPDVRRGIVDTRLLVRRVVAPGAVGRRDEDVGLPLVERFSIEAEPDVADRHDPPFSAHHADRGVGNLVAARRGRDDHGVGA